MSEAGLSNCKRAKLVLSFAPATLIPFSNASLDRCMHRYEPATVGEHGFDLHHWNEIGDAIHHISLGQGCAGVLRHIFDCLPGTRAVEGDGRYDRDSFRII